MFVMPMMIQVQQGTSNAHGGSSVSIVRSLASSGELHKLYRGLGVAGGTTLSDHMPQAGESARTQINVLSVMRGIPGAAITFTVQRKTREALD